MSAAGWVIKSPSQDVTIKCIIFEEVTMRMSKRVNRAARQAKSTKEGHTLYRRPFSPLVISVGV